MKRLTATLSAVLAAGALLAAPAVQAHEIVLGASLAKTGRFATLARATETAIDIAVEEINAKGGVNGHPIKLVKFDTGGDPKQAVVAVRRFAQDDNALAVIGPFSSAEARVAFAAGERLGIVQMPNASSAPKLPDKFSYAYRMTESEFTQTIRLVTSMKKKGIPMKTGAIFYASDEFVSKIVGTVIMKTVLSKAGVQLMGDPIGFPNAAFDMSPQVSQIRGKGLDIVAVGAIIQPAVKIKQEMDRQGIKARLIGSQLFADPGVEKTFGAAGDGTLFATSYWYKRSERTRAFNKKYVALNKKRGINKPWPHHVDASAYDIIYVFKKAMEIAGTTGDVAKLKSERTAIRDALKDIRYTGITGDICFESTGDAQLSGYIIELKNQEWTILDSHPPAPCTK